MGVVYLYQGMGWGTGGWYYCTVVVSTCASLLYSLMLYVSFLSDFGMVAVMSVSFFIICFICLCSL